MIGALSQTVDPPITTLVTCPTVRMHPVLTAQAAATFGVLLNGHFRLGVGTGEALNEQWRERCGHDEADQVPQNL